MNKAGTAITKEEFCEAIRTDEDCWLFENMTKLPGGNFWKSNDGIVYYLDGNGFMRRFKDMPEYGEIWSSAVRYSNNSSEVLRWSVWSTWTQYD